MGVWIENDAQKRKTQNSKPHPLLFSRGYRVLQDFAVKAGITVVVIYDEPLW